MKIRSECPSCTCYEQFENLTTGRRTMSTFGRTGYKTAEGWGRTSRNSAPDEPLEAVYNKNKFLPQRTKEPYNHNLHLMKVRKGRTQL